MNDTLMVRIAKLQKAHWVWLEDAEALRAPLKNSEWRPENLKASPAMPGGLKMLIADVVEATDQVRRSLHNGAATCTAAANAVGWAAGMYGAREQANEDAVRDIRMPRPR